MLRAFLLLLCACLPVLAQSPLDRLQAVHPGATIECQIDHKVTQGGAAIGAHFRCVEAKDGKLIAMTRYIGADEWPQEWPDFYSISVRRFVYATREDGRLVYLKTKPTPCDDDYASGGRGQLDTSSCGGFLFPAWGKRGAK